MHADLHRCRCKLYEEHVLAGLAVAGHGDSASDLNRARKENSRNGREPTRPRRARSVPKLGSVIA